MALYEYFCETCQKRFEQITSSTDPDQGKCPKCQGKNTNRLISRFAIGGQGDLRETTMHGCHDHSTGHEGDSGQSHDDHAGHDHSHHDHDHD